MAIRAACSGRRSTMLNDHTTFLLKQAMDAASVDMGPARSRAIQVAALAVGRGLSREHGLRRFYPLAQVQTQIGVAAVDGALHAWVYATFVSRADFDAYFAVRETPGTYARLRAAMSAPEARIVSPEPSDADWLDDLWWWLDQVAGDP